MNSLGLGVESSMEAPPALSGESSVEWSVSGVGQTEDDDESDSSDSDSEDINDVFGGSFLPHSDSDDDGIVFEQDGKEDEEWSESQVRRFFFLIIVKLEEKL